jgi:hypothetical protein
VVILRFGFSLERKKKSSKEPQEAFMRAINSAFWMDSKHNLENFDILHFITPK